MLKTLLLSILTLFFATTSYCYPIQKADCKIDQIIDRTLIIEGKKVYPSGYTPILPKWIQPGSAVSISYTCTETGDCYYIDIEPQNSTLPIMDKLNKGLLDRANIFP